MNSSSTSRPGGQETVQPIPFRPESDPVGETAVDVLLILFFLLGVATAVLWVAKRRGWLERWTRRAPTMLANPLRVEHRLRLSPRTMIYCVHCDRKAYLVVESTASASLHEMEKADETGV